MALQNYITIADITNINMKKFSDTIKQAYIDEANDYYEWYAGSVGVRAADLDFPVSPDAKLYLKAYAAERFAFDRIGNNDGEGFSDSDTYKDLFFSSKKLRAEKEDSLNYYTLTGNATTDRGAHSYSTGKRHRSS